MIYTLNSDRWIIEIYKTIIGALQGAAWMLLVFFLFALVAYVVVKGFEMKQNRISIMSPPPQFNEGGE